MGEGWEGVEINNSALSIFYSLPSDYTQAAYDHAKRKKRLAEELRPTFEAEGNMFLTEVQLGESEGTISAFEAGHFARYLYHVMLPSG